MSLFAPVKHGPKLVVRGPCNSDVVSRAVHVGLGEHPRFQRHLERQVERSIARLRQRAGLIAPPATDGGTPLPIRDDGLQALARLQTERLVAGVVIIAR